MLKLTDNKLIVHLWPFKNTIICIKYMYIHLIKVNVFALKTVLSLFHLKKKDVCLLTFLLNKEFKNKAGSLQLLTLWMRGTIKTRNSARIARELHHPLQPQQLLFIYFIPQKNPLTHLKKIYLNRKCFYFILFYQIPFHWCNIIFTLL